jgi:hypothetical protein
MAAPRKPHLGLREFVRLMHMEAAFSEARADLLGQAALKVEQDGDATRAQGMWITCRKMRVQALQDRARAMAAELKIDGKL